MRLLVVRQDRLGDALLCTPVLRAIREALPNALITVLCRRDTIDVFSRCSAVNSVMTSLIGAGDFDTALLMRPFSDDVAVDLHNLGVDTIAGCGASEPGLLTHDVGAENEWKQHEVERQTALAAAALGVDLKPGRIECIPFRDEFSRSGVLTPKWGFFCVSPGTGGSARAWPVSHYATLADAVAKKTELTPVIMGAPGEEDLCEELGRAMEAEPMSIAGRTSLGVAAAVLQQARFAISGNTGIRHIAASQKTPCVAIETMPEPEKWLTRWSPWQTASEGVLEEPMPSVDSAWAAAQKLIDRI